MNFMIALQEITSNYGEGNCLLVVRAFAIGAERTVRDNTVGSCGLAASANGLWQSKLQNLYFRLYTIDIFRIEFRTCPVKTEAET